MLTLSRTATKATIKRASAAGRRQATALDSRMLSDLKDAYARAAEQISHDIAMAAAAHGSVQIDVLQHLLAQIHARLNDLSNARGGLLEHGLNSAAAIGVHPFAEAISPTILASVSHDAVRFVRTFVAEDGLQLSDRIWRIDNHAREAVSSAVTQAVIQGKSASDAALEFQRRGDRIPPDLLAKMNQADAKNIQRKAGAALLRDDDNPLENAQRLFRTEINRAHGEAYQAAAFHHPDTIGTRFLLSPRHPRPDICDMHARVNKYGLGPGVYPKDKNPWPAHPNTLSYTEVVFNDEVSAEHKAGKEDRISWLKSQPPMIQEAVLGSRMKRGMLDAGMLTENQIATPWKDLKKRLESRGIDVGRLRPLPVEPFPQTPGSGGHVDFIDARSPVSAALRIEAQREAAQHVLSLIDSLHSDGRLPNIPIQNAPASASFYGAFYYNRGGHGVRISLRAGGSHKELTLAHEIGHFLDLDGTPGTGYASHASEIFAGWRSAIEKSGAIKGLRNLRAGSAFVKTSDGTPYPVDRKYIDYLLEPHELWARSYAQWVAMQTGDDLMLQQLENIRSEDRGGLLTYTRQWDDHDFKPIADAINEVMSKLGWTR